MLDYLSKLDFPTPFLSFISIFIYSICFMYALRVKNEVKKSIRTNSTKQDFQVTWFFILISGFCVFYFADSDWFHYYENYSILSRASIDDYSLLSFFEKTSESHMEKAYTILAGLSFENYFLFRFYIWGGALIFIILTIRRIGLNKSVFFYLFISSFLLLFAYGRVSLSFSIAFLGYSMIIYSKKNHLISILLGLFLISISLLFHKSAFFLIPIFLLSFLPYNKNTIIVSLIILVPVFFIVSNIESYIYYLPIESFQVVGALEAELDSKQLSDSGSLIRLFIVYYLKFVPYYIYLLGVFYLVVTDSLKQCPRYIMCFVASAVWIIIFATVFLFINQYLMFYRFMIFSIIPITITLAYFYANRISKTAFMIKGVLGVGLFMTTFNLLYSFYMAVVMN